MTFTVKFREKMKDDNIKMDLAKALGVSYSTMTRRLKLHKHDEITKPKYLKVLSDVTGIPQSEIFSHND